MVGTKPLSPKQLMFVRLYGGGASAKQAYIGAGYEARGNAAEGNAARLLRNAQVAALVDTAKQRAVGKALTAADLTAEWLTLAVARMVEFDPRKLQHPDGRWKDVSELDDDTAACIASIEFWPAVDGERPAVKRIKLWDKNAATRMGVAILGMVVERREIAGAEGGPIAVDLRGLADADLDALAAILGRLAYPPAAADAGCGMGSEGPAPAV